MQKETQKQRLDRYQGLQRMAEDALGKLVQSDTTPATVRAQAARTLLELTGALGRRSVAAADDGPDDFDPSRMTLGELDTELGQLLGRGAGMPEEV